MIPNGQPAKVFIIKVLMYNKKLPMQSTTELWCYVRDEYKRIEFHSKAGEGMIKKVMNREKVYFNAYMDGTTLKIGNEVQHQQW